MPEVQKMISSERKVWFRQVFLTLTEHGAVRGLDALTTILLVRILPASSFGLFAVYQSWVAMLLLFFPAIELALFREYATLKKENRLVEELSLYRFFNYLKLFLSVLVLVGLAFVPQSESWGTRFFLLLFAFALPFSQSFYSFMREPLRFEMRQGWVAALSLFQRAMLILGMLMAVLLFGNSNVVALVSAAMIAYILTGVAWALVSRDVFLEADWIPTRAVHRIKSVFLSVVLWIHLNGVVTQSIQTFDVFALNLFKTDLSEIALYSIALKAANFFQIVPVALASSIGVYLVRSMHSDASHSVGEREIWRYVLGFAVLSGLLFGIAWVFGLPLLSFLTKGKASDAELIRAYGYFLWQVAGALLLCVTYPVTTLLSIKAPLPKLFFSISLPWLMISVVAYLAAASVGPHVAAKANVFVSGTGALIMFWYYGRFRKERSDKCPPLI